MGGVALWWLWGMASTTVLLAAIVLTAMGKSSSKAPPEPSIPETNA